MASTKKTQKRKSKRIAIIVYIIIGLLLAGSLTGVYVETKKLDVLKDGFTF